MWYSGTTFSGICWAHTGSTDEQTPITWWPADHDCLEGVNSAKVPTQLQYTEDGFNWGFQIPHDMPRHTWFKLELDPGSPKHMSGIADSLADEKAAVSRYNQDQLERVVTSYFSALRQHFESTLAIKLSILSTTPVEYIITHPAIWSDSAKAAIQRCAERAGIGEGRNLQLLTEPEAAAIWALPRITCFQARIRDTFVLCDAGGGTVDLITYQIQSLTPFLKVVEAATGDGGLCGSTFLNRRFTAFLRRKLADHPEWQEEMLEEVR